MSAQNAPAASPADRKMFGHPVGLFTLFFTEMWERFSYYGMRSLLTLFLAAEVMRGGMGLDDKTATAIYGLYTAGVYLLALPGGWIADRLVGQQRAIWYGGIIIACGHFSMAIPSNYTFFLGLVLIVLGTGLLKPNVSTVVGDLYPEGARRDAGFSIFYMGINLGALLGPLFCGYVGEKINWHYGFALAGIGMVLGLIQYRAMNRFLGDHGRFPELKSDDPELQRRFVRKGWFWVAVGVGLIGLVYLLTIAGVIHINPVAVAGSSGIAMVAMGVLYFAGVLMFGKLGSMERRHVLVIAILCIGGIAFWAGFEQAGSNFNLFAERYTDRMAFGWQYPASWFQMANPLYILIFAPVFGWFWIALGRRNLNPSMPLKFGIGLALVGVGFLVMVAAAQLVIAKGNVLPTWLLLTYLLHTFGELSLSPVGLSSVTKLAPRRLGGQMMGMWFLATAIGDLAAGLIAGQFHADDVQAMPNIYWELALMLLGLGAIFAVFSRPIQKYLIGPDIE